MTMAVCIKCGEEKFGAWTPCSKCDFMPETDEEMAKSVILTDHHMPPESLKQVSALIKTGGEFEYPPDFLADWMAQDFESVQNQTARGCGGDLSCMLILAIPAVIGIVSLVWLVIALIEYFTV
ncbi:MAG: hypothetical protein K8I27_07265 [Planctomycetes bacterium]|nr:hypothetical protein [Planctomycetota bacterium]